MSKIELNIEEMREVVFMIREYQCRELDGVEFPKRLEDQLFSIEAEYQGSLNLDEFNYEISHETYFLKE